MSKEEIYLQILNSFTGTDELRPVFNKPFTQGEYVYATDAHILVRLNKSLVDIPEKEVEAPNCAALIPESKSSVLVDLKKLEEAISFNAPLIDEMAGEIIECSECDGEGEIECNLDHVHDCTKCDGDGEFNHQKPTGKKIPDLSHPVFLIDRGANMVLLRKILDSIKLLGVKTFELSSVSDLNKPLIFKASEVTFLIMPVMLDGSIKCKTIALKSILSN